MILLAAVIACGGSAADAERPPLICGGVEPFWSLEIGTDAALFTAPDRPDISYAIRDERIAEGRVWPRALTLTAPADTAIAVLRPASCSDTMSDRAYDWMVDLLTQSGLTPVIYTGCCRTKPGG